MSSTRTDAESSVTCTLCAGTDMVRARQSFASEHADGGPPTAGDGPEHADSEPSRLGSDPLGSPSGMGLEGPTAGRLGNSPSATL